jgi:hypothetical protein
LKVKNEIVGLLFINYRYYHQFSDEEKQTIEILSSAAAIAIKNQRWLSILGDIDREIITTFDQGKLLKLIARKSAQITAADMAEIRLVDIRVVG